MIVGYGPLSIGFKGEARVAGKIMAEFSTLPASNKSPDIVFNFSDRPQTSFPEKSGQVTKTGKALFSENRALLGTVSKWTCSLENSRGTLIVSCASSPNLKRRLADILPRGLQPLTNPYYKTIDELQAVDFVYAVFQPVVQMALLGKGASFIHASSLKDRDGQAVLFAGWGGCGKTSTSSSLLLADSKRWAFLGDDLSILDKTGTVSYNHVGMHVYPYNLNGNPELSTRILSRMRAVDRLHWAIRKSTHGPEGVVRRHSPRTIYGSVADSARVKTCIYLDRYFGDKVEIEQAGPDEIAKRACSVLLYEIRFFLEPLLQIGGSDSSLLSFPDVETLASGVKQVISGGLSNSRNFRVMVPASGMHPVEVAEEIRKRIIDA